MLMYEIHYKYRTAKYGSGAKLLFTETDSLVFKLRQMMFMKIFMKARVSLILLIILGTLNFMIVSIKK